ncbi:MAG: septum formation initiator family protein [Clostridia bacterium]|nr:septum formation initiator family protein [Clostridia bacterium]
MTRKNDTALTEGKAGGGSVIRAGRERSGRRSGETPLGKASVFVKPALIIVSVILLVISVYYFIEYSETVTERRERESELRRLDEEIEELEYYISAPMDEIYIRKFARELLGLVPSDEIIYITDSGAGR